MLKNEYKHIECDPSDGMWMATDCDPRDETAYRWSVYFQDYSDSRIWVPAKPNNFDEVEAVNVKTGVRGHLGFLDNLYFVSDDGEEFDAVMSDYVSPEVFASREMAA